MSFYLTWHSYFHEGSHGTNENGGTGPVLIPKEIRDQLGLHGGQELRVERDGDGIRITKTGDGEQLRQLKGCVSDPDADPMEAKRIWNLD